LTHLHHRDFVVIGTSPTEITVLLRRWSFATGATFPCWPALERGFLCVRHTSTWREYHPGIWCCGTHRVAQRKPRRDHCDSRRKELAFQSRVPGGALRPGQRTLPRTIAQGKGHPGRLADQQRQWSRPDTRILDNGKFRSRPDSLHLPWFFSPFFSVRDLDRGARGKHELAQPIKLVCRQRRTRYRRGVVQTSSLTTPIMDGVQDVLQVQHQVIVTRQQRAGGKQGSIVFFCGAWVGTVL